MTTREPNVADRQPQETGFEGRWKLIRRIHRNNRLFYRGMGLLLLFILGLFYFTDGYTTNAYTEALSILVTVFWLNELAANRAERQLKEELITDMGGQSNEFALRAVRLLKKKKWLHDGSVKKADLKEAELQGANVESAKMQGAILWKAKLQGANLNYANLEGAKLIRADLQGANLRKAKLQGANLDYANLQGADLRKADLQDAVLWRANLQGADLREANLQGAVLLEADLQGANLMKAKLQGATLPNGQLWHEGIDLSQFVNSTWPPPED